MYVLCVYKSMYLHLFHSRRAELKEYFIDYDWPWFSSITDADWLLITIFDTIHMFLWGTWCLLRSALQVWFKSKDHSRTNRPMEGDKIWAIFPLRKVNFLYDWIDSYLCICKCKNVCCKRLTIRHFQLSKKRSTAIW